MDTVFQDIGLHSEIAKYLNENDLKEYISVFDVDVPSFWNLLFIGRYKIKPEYIDGYPLKDIYFTTLYIEKYKCSGEEYMKSVEIVNKVHNILLNDHPTDYWQVKNMTNRQIIETDI